MILRIAALGAVLYRRSPFAQSSAPGTPPPTGKGKIVFYRANSRGVGCLVHEGEGATETRISKLTNNHYFVIYPDPGVHRYWAKNLAKDAVTLEVEAGETYYVRCSVAIGMMAANPNLSPSDADEYSGVSSKLTVMDDAAAD